MGLTESAVIIAGTLISIILFKEDSYLRKRSLYLVMNLIVADMLAGGIFTAHTGETVWLQIFKIFLGFIVECVFLWYLCQILLWFLYSSTHHVSSIQASGHQKVGLRCSDYCCLGVSCYSISITGSSRKRDHIIFVRQSYMSIAYVLLLSLFLTLLSLLNFLVERVLRTMVQLEDKENLLWHYS